jgi:type IV pilus assembly protein PilE
MRPRRPIASAQFRIARRSGPHAERAAAAGFTLVELVIVVAIAAILAAIAYPSYQGHLRKGRRSAAQSFLIHVATREQQYLIDARRYAGGSNALGELQLAVPADVSRFYTVAIGPGEGTVPPSYTITATPIPGSAQVPDGALTLDHRGVKTRRGQAGW